MMMCRREQIDRETNRRVDCVRNGRSSHLTLSTRIFCINHEISQEATLRIHRKPDRTCSNYLIVHTKKHTQHTTVNRLAVGECEAECVRAFFSRRIASDPTSRKCKTRIESCAASHTSRRRCT